MRWGNLAAPRVMSALMRQILDVSVAVNAIRTAFPPLACVVEIYSNDSRLRFRVLGPDKKPILSVAGISGSASPY